jgi:hypothetical protein
MTGDILLPHESLQQAAAKPKTAASKINVFACDSPALEQTSGKSKVTWLTASNDSHLVLLQDILTGFSLLNHAWSCLHEL